MLTRGENSDFQTGGKRSDLVVTVWNLCHAISQLRWVYWYGVHCGVRQLFYLFPRLYVRVAGDLINQISRSPPSPDVGDDAAGSERRGSRPDQQRWRPSIRGTQIYAR